MLHCTQYRINNELCKARVISKNIQVQSFLNENSEIFEEIYRITITTKPKWFDNIYKNEGCDSILIITKIIICSFLDGSHNICNKEKKYIYIDMYLILSDVLHRIVKNISSYFLTISIDTYNSEKDMLKWAFKIIEIGTKKKIFEDKIIWKKKKSIKLKRIISTYKHFIMHLNIEYYEKPYTKIIILGVPYLTTCYYLDKINIIRNNEQSKDKIEYKPDYFKFIVEASSIKYIVDEDRLETIINMLNIKNQYADYISDKEYLKAINNTTNTKAISEFYTKLLILYIDKFLKNKELFFPHFCDFRWRIYNSSSIGITASKIFRYIYTYGKYSLNEINEIKKNLEKSKTHNIVIKLLNFEIKKNITDPLILDSLFWTLIELGKINKNSLIINGFVECSSLIKEGYDLYTNKKNLNNNDLEDQIGYFSLKKIIEKIYNNEYLCTKHIIYKDSTASVLQLMTKLLGWKKPFMLEVMNIDSIENKWYDPYTYIINKYIENIAGNLENNTILLKRKNLKKIIMTVQYSASTDSALKYYAESKNIKINALDKNERNNIISFKKYLTDIVEQEHLFLKNSSSLTEEWNKNMYIYTNDNVCFSLNYNKKRKKQIEITVDNKRKSIINYEITNAYDKHKTKQSLRANIVHVMDAYIARNIILNWKIGTIHDSFGIDIYRTSLLIDNCNYMFNNNIMDKKSAFVDTTNITNTFSIFILL